MAATYTEVTLEDMEKFLKRGFRSMRPKQGVLRNEYYYELSISGNVAIRVMTSIGRGSNSGADVGADAIRVQLMGVGTKRPLMTGKAPIVKRTQGWRNNLQDRIEDLLEAYEEKPDYWESKGGGQPLAAPAREEVVDDNDGEAYADDMPPTPAPSVILKGTFTKVKGEEWGARIQGRGAPGARAILQTKSFRKVPVTLQTRVWSGTDRYNDGYVELWTIDQKQRTAAEEPEYSYDHRSDE